MKNKNIIFVIILAFTFILTSCLTVEKKTYTFELTSKNTGKLTIKYYNIMSSSKSLFDYEDYLDEDYEYDEDYDFEDEDEYAVEDNNENEEPNEAEADFEELVFKYLLGDKIEEEYPMATNFNKRLFEEDGVLCGVVTMEFNSLEAVKLFKHSKKTPIMFSISSAIDSEYYEDSNGDFGNADYMNVVFWKSNKKKLQLTTTVSEPDDKTESLLPYYLKWKM